MMQSTYHLTVLPPSTKVVFVICVGETCLFNVYVGSLSWRWCYERFPLLFMSMFWSKYNFLEETSTHDYLLFNTMSMQFLFIEKKDISTWLNLKNNPDSYIEFSNSDFLLQARIIVPNQNEDLELYLLDVIKNKYNPSDMALTILPTRACNFGCIYCYELERPNEYMSEETEKAVLKFIRSNNNLRKLNVTWYGGEPLLNFNSIQRLTKAFINLGVEYSAKMITNGYLLTPEIAGLLHSLHINTIQITFDGTESVHNKRRFLLGGQPTYRKIMDNIKYLLSVDTGIRINIRTNVDKRNKENYEAFRRDFLSEISSEQVVLYPGFVSDVLSNDCASADILMNEGENKAKFVLDIYNNYGIIVNAFMPKYRRHSCVATKYNAFVIGPKGQIWKCWKMVGNEKECLGNINTGEFDMYKFSQYMIDTDYTRDSRCLECNLISLCGGGCPLLRMRNKNEGLNINHCCPEKGNMKELMNMRYQVLQAKL